MSTFRPVCVPCGSFFQCAQNDVVVEIGELKAIENLPAKPEWISHELRSADRWKCADCGHEIVIGFAQNPISHSFQADYAERLAEVERKEEWPRCRVRVSW